MDRASQAPWFLSLGWAWVGWLAYPCLPGGVGGGFFCLTAGVEQKKLAGTHTRPLRWITKAWPRPNRDKHLASEGGSFLVEADPTKHFLPSEDEVPVICVLTRKYAMPTNVCLPASGASNYLIFAAKPGSTR